MVFLNFIFFILSWLRILLRSFKKKKHCGLLQCFSTWFLFCYSVFLYFFFKIIFVDFFYIELVKNLALTFPACFISHFYLFLFLFAFFSKLSSSFYFFVFFSELFLSILFFFNIELVENLEL